MFFPHQTEEIKCQKIVNSSPILDMKTSWGTLVQSLSLTPTHLAELLWGKQKENYYVCSLPSTTYSNKGWMKNLRNKNITVNMEVKTIKKSLFSLCAM